MAGKGDLHANSVVGRVQPVTTQVSHRLTQQLSPRRSSAQLGHPCGAVLSDEVGALCWQDIRSAWAGQRDQEGRMADVCLCHKKTEQQRAPEHDSHAAQTRCRSWGRPPTRTEPWMPHLTPLSRAEPLAVVLVFNL